MQNTLALAANPILVKADQRVPELDGIRAIAIWMVLILHAFIIYPRAPGAFDHVPFVLLTLAGHGWLGVDLFFVLSGFLITGILLDSKPKPHYFRNFYARRALRILPVYFVAISAMALFYTHFLPFYLLSTIFMANFAMLFHIPAAGPGRVLWSLAVEEQFYLVWPLLVRALSRRVLAWIATIILFLEPLLRLFAYSKGWGIESVIYVLTCFRLDGLALGALLALWFRRPAVTRAESIKLAGLLLGLVAVITLVGIPFGIHQTKSAAGVAFRYDQATFVFGAGLILVLVFRTKPVTAVFRSRFATLCADLSYCIYIIHIGIGDAYQYLFGETLQPRLEVALGPLTAVLVRGGVIIVVTFALAMLSRRFIERPALALKRHFV